jgi:uncharacterized metal-binding protein YceD (DUF177 family)
MLRSKEYILEFNKVRKGLNEYSFAIDASFLAGIEGSSLSQANVTADLQLMKSENLYELKFHLKGTVQCECDICLEEFSMPIDADYKLLMKLSETENYDDDEIIYITEKLIEYDLSQYLYESLLLSIPSRRVCEMSGDKSCNEEVVAKLEGLTHFDADAEDDETNPTWDKLKDIFNN